MNRTIIALCVLSTAVVAEANAQGGYGRAVAASGGVLYVGESETVARSGGVYAYERDANGRWVERARLTATSPRPGDGFGRAVGAAGATLVVGQPTAEGGRGALYVFERRGSEWRQTARLLPAGAAAGDSVGVAVAVQGDVALAVLGGGRGGVVVFRRNGSAWSEEARLSPADVQPGDRFGAAVAIASDRIVVGAPGQAERAGAAYLFERANGAWTQTAKLVATGARPGDGVGTSVAFVGERLAVGAPARDGAAGAVHVFVRESDRWNARTRLQPVVAANGAQFGATLAAAGSDALWVGTPGAMTIVLYTRNEAGEWAASPQLRHPRPPAFNTFGDIFAASDAAVVVGRPDMLGSGTAAVFERRPDATWAFATDLASEPEEFETVVGRGVTACAGGTAGQFGCNGVDLLGYLPISALGGTRGTTMTDIWGWTDSQTGREYAIVGRSDGTAFVDITDPSKPRYLGNLPLTKTAHANVWRDVKVYRNHAFVVADNAGQHGMQIFDLTQLRSVTGEPKTFTETALYTEIASAHNVVINEETGLAVAVASSGGGRVCGGGLHMIDVREPTKPTFAGCFTDPRTGRGATHDAQCVTYRGPDEKYRGREICIGSNEAALSVADVTDRANPIAVSRASYPNVNYAHQGWFTDDHRFFYMNDEGDELAGAVPKTRTIIWDLTDLDDPQVAGEYLGTTSATDHNLYVRGDTMYQANYMSGLRIIDISNRTQPREIGFFDSVPNSPDVPGFRGAWSSYPYFKSGNIIFTSIREGLFIVRKSRPIS